MLQILGNDFSTGLQLQSVSGVGSHASPNIVFTSGDGQNIYLRKSNAALMMLGIDGSIRTQLGGDATTPTASFSGATTNAGLIVDQSGSGDLFTASNSGATKFVINNAGNVIANNYNQANGGILMANSSGLFQEVANGGANQCLAMNSGANGFVWSTCGGAGSNNNYWQLNNGAIAPFSTTARFVAWRDSNKCRRVCLHRG